MPAHPSTRRWTWENMETSTDRVGARLRPIVPPCPLLLTCYMCKYSFTQNLSFKKNTLYTKLSNEVCREIEVQNRKFNWILCSQRMVLRYVVMLPSYYPSPTFLNPSRTVFMFSYLRKRSERERSTEFKSARAWSLSAVSCWMLRLDPELQRCSSSGTGLSMNLVHMESPSASWNQVNPKSSRQDAVSSIQIQMCEWNIHINITTSRENSHL